ncbi:MAG: efflux transporter outer membrane subunit [Caulobacterales bacterium]|nr:efflux transporter outer membrane subunit [Caulobacterales bacterium]MCA0374015.1 efflux transporter outer membrane subunit [Pseudomonadota bacterium]
MVRTGFIINNDDATNWETKSPSYNDEYKMASSPYYTKETAKSKIRYNLLERVSILGLFAFALSACAQIPNPKSSIAPIATSTIDLSANISQNAAEWPKEKWWVKYNDAQLNNLIELAFNNSPSIDIAKTRIEQAIIYSEGVDATYGLHANADATAYLQKQTYNGLFPKAFAPKGVKDFGQVTLSASKDLDIWGQRRAELQAAGAQIDSARADEAFVRINLSSAIANEYARLQNLYTQKQNLELLLDNAKETAKLVNLRFKNGLEIKARTNQAQAQVDAIKLQIETNDERIKLEKSAIAALIGDGPQVALSIHQPKIYPIFEAQIPSDLRADILGHRPDIIAAKMRAIFAAKKVDVAITKYYPNVSLSGNIGLSSLGIANLLDTGSLIGQFGPAVSLPLFAQKTLDANLGNSNAEYNLAIANYNKSLIDAFNEIDQASISFIELKSQIDAAHLQTSETRAALENIRLRYKGGVGNYIDVLNAQAVFLNAQNIEANLQDQRLIVEIALIKSLGGGYVFKE